MKKVNALWHQRNVMPRNATLEERVKWHLEHSEECGCRPMPRSIVAEIRKRRIR